MSGASAGHFTTAFPGIRRHPHGRCHVDDGAPATRYHPLGHRAATHIEAAVVDHPQCVVLLHRQLCNSRRVLEQAGRVDEDSDRADVLLDYFDHVVNVRFLRHIDRVAVSLTSSADEFVCDCTRRVRIHIGNDNDIAFGGKAPCGRVAAMSLSLLKFVGQASLVDDAMLPS